MFVTLVITSCIVGMDTVPTTLGRPQMTSAEHAKVQNDATAEGLSPEAQVTITGRNVEVPEHFQERVNSKPVSYTHLRAHET